MATDVERLVVSLEASTTKYERAMQRALGQTNAKMRQIEQRAQRAGVNVSGALGKALTLTGGAASLGGVKALLDTNTRITNSLKVSGLEGEKLTKVYDQLAVSAKRNGASFEALAGLYGRAALVQNELGVSSEDLTKFTNNVAVALRVAGTDAQSASGALLQLSQALGAGVVRAEEFNSILEGAPTIAQAAAAGITEAGGSVAKLRQLVVDGKVSSDVFFKGFQLGAAELQERAGSSVFTISQSFERLYTTLIQAVGQFDSASGASKNLAEDIYRLSAAVDRLADSRFVQWLGDVNRFLQSNGIAQLDSTISELERLGGVFDGLGDNGARAFTAAENIERIELAARNAVAAMLGFDSIDVVPPDQAAKIDAFIVDLANTEKSSAELQQALIDLGAQQLNFQIAFSALAGLRGELQATRSEAVATAAAIAATAAGVSSGSNISDQRAEQSSLRPRVIGTVSITESAIPPGSSGGGGGGSGRGGGSSASDTFGDALKEQQRRIDELNRETAARRELGAAYDENGFAAERLKVQLDLENEAARAGLELTPARKAAIDELADGYARASVEAEALQRSQDLATEAMDNFADAAQTGIRGFIDDLIEGKSATEALGNALASIGNALLSFGLDSLFSFFKPGGGGLAALFPGREAGGPVRKGQPYIVGEKRPEIFVPNQSGTIVPRIPTMPSAAPAGMGGGQLAVDVNVGVDEAGNITATVTRISGQVAGQAIKANNKQLPGLMRDVNQRVG